METRCVRYVCSDGWGGDQNSKSKNQNDILKLIHLILEVMGWMGYSILIIYGVSVYEVETGAD